jgi:hypothetical protein
MNQARFALALLAAPMAAGCTPHIGDKCLVNTDCSISNTRQCDTSQPTGYCTVFNCAPNSCPDNAACVLFQASIAGCPLDDYSAPSRTGRTFCMQTCNSDSDCRQSDGYRCADPTGAPWSAQIVDDTQGRHVCILASDSNAGVSSGEPVCPGTPSKADAGARVADAGVADGGAGPGADAGMEAGADAGTDAAETGADGAADAGDAASGSPQDATVDGGAGDAAFDSGEGG